MKYNLREIMTTAHYIRKEAGVSMSEALRWAWAEAKENHVERVNTIIESLEREMFCLQMKDRWDSRDYAVMDKMKGEVTTLKASIAA